MGVGKKLVQLLHADDVIKDKKKQKKLPPSTPVKKLITRANQLTSKGTFWHHHMLFPGCKFNNHNHKWVIIFEDQEKGEIIESVTNNEPKNDLQHIEALFYSKKK